MVTGTTNVQMSVSSGHFTFFNEIHYLFSVATFIIVSKFAAIEKSLGMIFAVKYLYKDHAWLLYNDWWFSYWIVFY